MVYYDVEVRIPKNCRLLGDDEKSVYETIHLNSSCESGDEIFIGIAIDEYKMHPSKLYFLYHPSSKVFTDEEVKEYYINAPVEKNFSIGANLVIRSIISKLSIDTFINKAFGTSAEVLTCVIEQLILSREFTTYYFNNYINRHFTKLIGSLTSDRLSSILELALQPMNIRKFLGLWYKERINSLDDNKCIDIYFDSNNFNISSINKRYEKYGHPLGDKLHPKANIVYFMDNKYSMPFNYEFYYGSSDDITQTKSVIKSLKEISPDLKGRFVFDNGYFSAENIHYLETNKINFVMMGGFNKKFNYLSYNYSRIIIMASQNLIGDNIYGKKFKGRVVDNDDTEYYIYLFYNDKFSSIQSKELLELLKVARNDIVGKIDYDNNITNTYGKYLKIKYEEVKTERGVQKRIIKADLDYASIEQYKDMIGFFWAFSTTDEPMQNVLSLCFKRDEIEKSLLYSKEIPDSNEIYSDDIRLFNEKTFMSFLSLIVETEVKNMYKDYLCKYIGGSVRSLLNELENVEVVFENNKYILKRPLNSRQKYLLDFVGITEEDILTSANSHAYRFEMND